MSFLENEEGWHGKVLNKKELEKALGEISIFDFPEIKIKKPTGLKIKITKKKRLIHVKYPLNKEFSTREAYGNSLASLAKSDENVIVLDAEVGNSTFSELVKKSTPKQFIESYIAEQNMVGMALGLSVKGFNVFASTFSAFFTRAHDQLRMSAVSNPKSLTFCGSHAGTSIGSDGVSQMGLDDIAMFRGLPRSIVLCPSDAVSTEKLTNLSYKIRGLKYIRTTRPKVPVIYKNSETFKIGNFKVLKQSKKDKFVIAGSGITVHESLKAHEELKKHGINSSVVDLFCVKPFNSKKFENFVKKKGKKLIVVEDHYAEGGIGEMLAENLENSGIKIKHLAVREIPHSGTKEELLKKCGIDSSAIVKSAKNFG